MTIEVPGVEKGAETFGEVSPSNSTLAGRDAVSSFGELEGNDLYRGGASTMPEGQEMVPPGFRAVDFTLHVGYAKGNNVPANEPEL